MLYTFYIHSLLEILLYIVRTNSYKSLNDDDGASYILNVFRAYILFETPGICGYL